MDLLHIPLADICDTALLRDRTALDPEAPNDLTRSIFTDGLHQPIEVYRLDLSHGGPHSFGLISGLRRLTDLVRQVVVSSPIRLAWARAA